MATEDSGTSLPRRQLGRYLRKGRQDANLKLEDVAPMMQWSPSKLSRLERGEPGKLYARDIELLCQILGFDTEQTAAMKGLAQQAVVKNWWHGFGDLIPEGFSVFVGLETSAVEMTIYRPDLVPGLFQTADYARALDRIWFAKDSEEEQDRRIQLRMSRQTVITRKTKPARVDIVLYESVLHAVVGGPRVMSAQLRHLADLSTKPNIAIRVLPFKAGFPVGGPVGPFTMLDFGSDAKGNVVEPTVIYVESFTGAMYLEHTTDVDRYRAASIVIQQAALDAVTSRNLLRQGAREFERER
ncbi:helix-turn-helix domain-containing protein [Nocardia sp. NPDC057440]|uniref:helix-turn-helix domain-containing protein n=1 Tax=Nocardia sp. NPDC057440 TaxID=3346134 RepID=UPI00367225EB